MIERRVLALAATALIVASVSGCTAAPQPTVTVAAEPLPAVTVTATPTPASGDTPLDSLVAWTACAGFLMTFVNKGVIFVVGQKNPDLLAGQNSYSPDLVTQTGDSFRVQLVGVVGDPQYSCTVSGTFGAPIISQWVADSARHIGTP